MTETSCALRSIRDVEAGTLATFACTRDELREFLVESALDYADHGLTETAIAFLEQDPAVAGYFSLSADGLQLSEAEKFELGLPFECQIRYFPAVKITKLAVRSDLQGKGVGSQLMKLIVGLAYNGSVSVRLLTVDAANSPEVIKFYQRHGFKTTAKEELRQGRRQAAPARNAKGAPKQKAIEDIEPRTILMYKDLHDGEDPINLSTPVPSDEPPQFEGVVAPAGVASMQPPRADDGNIS